MKCRKWPLSVSFYDKTVLFLALKNKTFVARIACSVEVHADLTFAQTKGPRNNMRWGPASHVEVKYFFIQFIEL